MLNLKALCQDRGIAYIESGHHHCHAGWAQLHCPFCSDGSYGYHLGFNTNEGNFNCWRCGKHKVWNVLEKLLRTTNTREINEAYQKYKSDQSPRKRKQIARKRSIKLPDGTENLRLMHRSYLIERKFDPKALEEEWGIKGTRHLSGEWNWRIIIPITDHEGNVVAYQGRAINDDVRPKYKMADDKDCLMDPKSLVYGLHKAKEREVIIVEGITDVWRLGPGSVATLGIDWNTDQANEFRKFTRRFIAFDPEPEAQKRAEKLAKWLSYYPGTTEIIEDLACDPGEMDEEEVEQLKSLLRRE